MTRGTVEIYPTDDGMWVVYDWSAHHGSGWCEGDYPTREEAIIAGLKLSYQNNRALIWPCAELTVIDGGADV